MESVENLIVDGGISGNTQARQLAERGKKEKINLCFACDEAYLPYAAVVFYSALKSRCAADKFCVWIITNSSSPSREAWFKGLFPQEEIHFVQAPDDFLNAPVVKKHLSKAAYMRLLVGKVLPAEVKKIIYLDCDLLVLESLAPLFEWDLKGKIASGLEDWGVALLRKEGRFTFPWPDPYIGSGLLLIDLERWRQSHAQERCVAYAKNPLYPIQHEDQDVLNFVLHGELGVIPCKWDVVYYIPEEDLVRRKAPAEWLEAMKTPAIIHFATGNKPWFIGCNPPYYALFRQYMKDLNISLKHFSVRKQIFFLAQYLWRKPVFYLKPSFWKKVKKYGLFGVVQQ